MSGRTAQRRTWWPPFGHRRQHKPDEHNGNPLMNTVVTRLILERAAVIADGKRSSMEFNVDISDILAKHDVAQDAIVASVTFGAERYGLHSTGSHQSGRFTFVKM